MDCMNSSESSHSSSGGEDEYDSRADQGFSSFSHLGPTYNQPPPPPSQHNHHHTTTTTNISLSNFPSSSSSSFMYDPLFSSTFLDPSSLLLNTAQNNSSVLLSTYSHDQAQGQLKDQGGRQHHFSPLMMLPNEGTATHPISRQLSNDSSTFNNTNSNKNIDADDNNNNNNNINNSSITNSSSNNNNLAVRNPKKRSRASRRAPTTVLTTDTSNFRAMVQEFTGIPAPPFAAAVASSFNRTRSLDLFGGSSTPHPYLLRPFAQRSHTIPNYLSTTAPSSSSLSILTNSVMSNTNPLSSINTNNNSSNSMNYQLESLPSNLGLLKNQPLNLLSMSQIMQSQSSTLIQDLHKYPLGNASTIFPSSKPSGPSLLDHISTTSSDPSMKMGGLGTDFGLDTHHHHPTGGFRDEADGTTPTTDWDGRLGSKNNVDDQGLLRSISGSFGNFQRVSSEDKRIDESNGSTRSESMVEPWLRSSSSG